LSPVERPLPLAFEDGHAAIEAVAFQAFGGHA
jgi:hypothetical protein